ncbi:hypothetical protein THASP1DRAFT_21369 [Thamnocephalis sphaerospora]|uniref:NADAR domain-containing protein n=1 Tax=Thamnocephalis sphaerospora TaxID=78915 RepID=A0A4P9XXD3_9FUNG|nr:hypothetical protein THASP1DRAFT_21369 [Thamnocephalis sphaerospora]|eukprot:RKP10974.1 hypothetical protein THASP1DRAFT_21369 [Thamnocephalis sphaerospora]
MASTDPPASSTDETVSAAATAPSSLLSSPLGDDPMHDDGHTHYDVSAPVVYFYRCQDAQLGHLSNFYASAIYLDGERWPTTEHYFQAAKFTDVPNYQREIRLASTPGKAARMGRSRAHPLRADWETVKETIMERAVFAKYTQHANLATQLLATGSSLLVEHTFNDVYWADGGGDGRGLNRLGVILMRVHTWLLQQPPPSPRRGKRSHVDC